LKEKLQNTILFILDDCWEFASPSQKISLIKGASTALHTLEELEDDIQNLKTISLPQS